MNPQAMAWKPLTRWKRLALNVFIGVHVYLMFFWGLPNGPLRNRLVRPLEKYGIYTGLWHTWGMFAPFPLTIHFDIRAEVKYEDGTTAEWIAPRMEELSIWERAPKERFRKWRERIRTDDNMVIWDDTARFVARQLNNNPTNLPVEVKLTRHWIETPPPNLKQDYQPMPKSFATIHSYTYAVVPISPKDLR